MCVVGCEFEGEVGAFFRGEYDGFLFVVELPEHFVDVSVEEEACEGELYVFVIVFSMCLEEGEEA